MKIAHLACNPLQSRTPVRTSSESEPRPPSGARSALTAVATNAFKVFGHDVDGKSTLHCAGLLELRV